MFAVIYDILIQFGCVSRIEDVVFLNEILNDFDMVVHHRDSAFYKIEEVHTRLVIIDYNKVSFKEGFY